MRKIILLSFALLLTQVVTKAQFYEIHPHFVSVSGGAGTISFNDAQFPGYHGKLEGAFFYNYLFGTGLQASHSYFKPLENTFADQRINTPRHTYNLTTADVDYYIVENYTANAYFVAMPTWWFSFMGLGGAGFQRLLTPQGTIQYDDFYPYLHFGEADQTSTIDVVREKHNSVVFHLGMRANLMVTDRFGFTFGTDYHFAKNKKYANERLHQFSGSAGIIVKLYELLY